MFVYREAYDDGGFLIRHDKQKGIMEFRLQRFDEKQKKWIDDDSMCGIFSGDIPVKSITEKEAMEIIKNYDSN